MGGQTGLNLASTLAVMGVFKEYEVKVLGTPIETIQKGEDRDAFAALMKQINEPIPPSKAATNISEALEAGKKIGYPVIVRPAYTLGGGGGGIANNEEELEKIASHGMQLSMIHQVLIEKSVAGWYEFEYEVIRDRLNNCIIICSMENVDPIGIHTGESIVVAPAQTLSDIDNSVLKNASVKIIRALGIEGGCNIQFAMHPVTREYVVIEVNPRVSRSSALASKATGYPIARVSAKIAIGKTLDEIPNSITKKTPASFEPSIDYIVVKVPRWPFDKFKDADKHIGTQMKSTGEVMAIGRTFEEALQKAIRSLDIGKHGFTGTGETDMGVIKDNLAHPTDKRLYYIYDAFHNGMTVDEISNLTAICPFFLHKMKKLYDSSVKK
jgi:carbamoyl-phosphate synthase large subunit